MAALPARTILESAKLRNRAPFDFAVVGGVSGVQSFKPMKFAYADPPYMGQAVKHYGKEAKAAGRTAREVNHEVLIGTLCDNYDGWALSLSAPSLQRILPMCPANVRVAAWVKPFCAFKKNVNPAYTWEPVIFWGGRKRTVEQLTTKDHLIESITMRKGFAGAKPVRFCYWLFEMLGMEAADDFTDVFPGSGIVSSSWQAWQRSALNVPPELCFAHETRPTAVPALVA